MRDVFFEGTLIVGGRGARRRLSERRLRVVSSGFLWGLMVMAEVVYDGLRRADLRSPMSQCSDMQNTEKCIAFVAAQRHQDER